MLSPKGRGQHSGRGTAYYWCLAVVFVSLSVLSIMRWTQNYHLFILGVLSFAAASIGRTALRNRWEGWVRVHISGMGLSYVLLLTAFYVDNGPNLPLWQALSSITAASAPGSSADERSLDRRGNGAPRLLRRPGRSGQGRESPAPPPCGSHLYGPHS